MGAAERLVANPVVVLRQEFDDWAVLYNPDSGRAIGINPTAVAVWKAVDGRRSAPEIAEAVTARYHGVPEGAADEVEALLAQFVDEGFVEREVD